MGWINGGVCERRLPILHHFLLCAACHQGKLYMVESINPHPKTPVGLASWYGWSWDNWNYFKITSMGWECQVFWWVVSWYDAIDLLIYSHWPLPSRLRRLCIHISHSYYPGAPNDCCASPRRYAWSKDWGCARVIRRKHYHDICTYRCPCIAGVNGS